MVSLIIPAYNEQNVIENTIKVTEEFMHSKIGKHELIIVDDGSTDSTQEKVCGSDAKLISLPQNRGKGAAVREGVLNSLGDYIFFTDSDLPYCLEFINEGLEILKSGDVVCGSRFGNYPFHRRIVSAIYNNIANNILQIGISDIQCGIKGFARKAAIDIFSLSKTDGFAFDTEVLFLARQLGYKIDTLAVNLTHRTDSKVNVLGDGLQMFADILRIRGSFEAGEYNTYKTYQR